MKINSAFLVFLISLGSLVYSCKSVIEEPTEEKMKADLLGQTVSMGGTSYFKFESLSEFHSLKKSGRIQSEDVIEYLVELEVQDRNSLDAFPIIMIYRKENIEWKLVNVGTPIGKYVFSGILTDVVFGDLVCDYTQLKLRKSQGVEDLIYINDYNLKIGNKMKKFLKQ